MIGNSVGLGRQIAIATMLVGCLVIFYAWCGRALALDPALDISQYAHTAWRLSEGFVKGRITGIAQTSDGYVWLGTELGLVRFDGARAVAWQPPHASALPDGRIRALLGARDGTLWIGTVKGLASWDGARLVTYPQLAGSYVNALIEDRDGTVWIGANTDEPKPVGLLCAARGPRLECQGEDGTLGIGVSSLYEDSRGFLWVAELNRMWRWRPGPPVEYSLPDSIWGLQALGELEPGVILIATSKGVEQLVNDRPEPSPLPLPSRLQPRDPLRDRDGAVWMGTNSGLYHVHQRRVDAFTQADGLSGNYVISLFEDREGSMWVATSNGLDRFHLLGATMRSPGPVITGPPGSVLVGSDGSMWVGAEHGLYRWADGHTYQYRSESESAVKLTSLGSSSPAVDDVTVKGLPHLTGATLHEDRKGRMWIGSQSGLGHIEDWRFVSVDGIPGGYIDSIAEDARGDLWIAHRAAGLFQLSPNGKLKQIAWPNISTSVIKHFALDPADGGIWVAAGTSVLHLVAGKWHSPYTTREGLGKGIVEDVMVDGSGSVWAATEGGVSRIRDGRVSTLDSLHGLPCDTVHTVIEDEDRALWLYMTCGLVGISRADLDHWFAAMEKDGSQGTVRTTLLEGGDGVKTASQLSTYRPVAAKSREGKLLFQTDDGIMVVDPRHLPYNKFPPPIHVEQVVADRNTYDTSSPVRLPPLIRDLEIQYTALSLVVPEKVRFKYKLEGRDNDWQDVGNRRRAFYTDLPPGDYRFRVIAANNSGVWNEEGATLDFSIEPAYWQTNWFRALVVVALLALGYAIYRLRVAQMARHFNQTLDARVNERTRIARDLHDTLLQSFHGLLLRFQTARSLLPANPAKAAEVLDSAIDQAAGAITEGRDAVQGLRTSATEMNDLAESIRALGEELATANGNSVVLRVDVQGAPRPLHPIVRDEVFRIASEALRNAFKHAGAEQIEVELHYDEGQVRLRVRDDGKGIPQELLRAEGREGHFGLHGMRERAKLAGGKLVIWSGPDAGTEVELSIPASHAYSKASRPRSWLAEKVMGQGDSSDS